MQTYTLVELCVHSPKASVLPSRNTESCKLIYAKNKKSTDITTLVIYHCQLHCPVDPLHIMFQVASPPHCFPPWHFLHIIFPMASPPCHFPHGFSTTLLSPWLLLHVIFPVDFFPCCPSWILSLWLKVLFLGLCNIWDYNIWPLNTIS